MWLAQINGLILGLRKLEAYLLSSLLLVTLTKALCRVPWLGWLLS